MQGSRKSTSMERGTEARALCRVQRLKVICRQMQTKKGLHVKGEAFLELDLVTDRQV